MERRRVQLGQYETYELVRRDRTVEIFARPGESRRTRMGKLEIAIALLSYFDGGNNGHSAAILSVLSFSEKRVSRCY